MSEDELDPDIREFHRRVNADYARLGTANDVAHRRRIAEQVRAPWAAGGPVMASTEKRGVCGIRIRIYRPVDATILPALIYLHGGGWVLFSLDTHDRLMREYAARSGCAVIGIDYSRSPEVRFPRALDEIAAVLDWLRSEGSAFGLDTSRIAIGGDSAGANLALSTAIRLRDAEQRWLSGMLLNYGAFDSAWRPSYDRYDSDRYMLQSAEMVEFWAAYLGDAGADDPLAKPLRAKLVGLPSTFFCIAPCDILADENEEMAARLRSAGVAVEAKRYVGAAHSFLEAVSISALAARALEDGSRWLANALAPRGGLDHEKA